MRVLLISAAPSESSLTAELGAVAAETLREEAHEVEVVDLYAESWDPRVTSRDYGIDAITEPVGTHAARALAGGTLAPEVAEQQRLLGEAELLILSFPLWWAGMPAILKGWVDRVFTEGFAYGLHDAEGNTRKYGDGAFAGTRALVMVTAGDRDTAFEPRGVNGDIEELLFPITHGILWYTGIASLAPLALLGVDSPLWAGIDDARERVRLRMRGLAAEAPIPYRRMLDDYDGQRRLLPQHAPGRTGLGVHRADGDLRERTA